jgi:hypothetical protein
MGVDFDYSNLTEADTEIYRVTCFAMRDPDHPIPSRCHMSYLHVGNHKSKEYMKTVEEWANEDPL